MQDKASNFLKSQSSLLDIRKPVFCSINISTRCLLKCKMCSIWKSSYTKNPEEPTLAEWCRFIDFLADLTDNCIEINITGGEPLLDKRNLALIGFSVEKGLPTSMSNNGFLIDKKMAQEITDSGLGAIGISLDGINKATHDFLRGTEGSYDKVMRAVDYLSSCNGDLQIGINTTILKENLHEIVSLAKWVNEDDRIRRIIFQAITQPFNTPDDNEWYKKSEYNMLWPQDIKNTHATIDELIRLKKIGYKISNSVSQLETFKRYFENPGEFITTHRCNIDFYMNINQVGDVFVCSYRKGFIGNIKLAHPKDLWYSEKANQVREGIKNCRVNCHHLLNSFYEEK